MAFPPKGTKPDDSQECIRTAECTRPITIKNSDNKTIVGVVNNSAALVLAHCASRVQNGFIKGRKFFEQHSKVGRLREKSEFFF